MPDSRSYNLPAATSERLRILDWITDNGGETPDDIVPLGALLTDDERTASAVAGHLDGMEDQGLIELQTVMDYEGWSCNMRPKGISFRDEVRSAREDLMERRKQCRDAYLEWLNNESLKGNKAPDVSAFTQSPYGQFLGQPFTDQEVAAASKWLVEGGYVKGTATWGGGILRPSITPKGETTVEQGRSVNAAETPVPFAQTTVNVTGHGNNVAANSSGVTQSTTVTLDGEKSHALDGVAETLAQMANAGQLGLTDEGTVEAAELVEQIRAMAQREEVPSTELTTLLDKAKTVALSGTGTVMGGAFVAVVQQLAQSFGLA